MKTHKMQGWQDKPLVHTQWFTIVIFVFLLKNHVSWPAIISEVGKQVSPIFKVDAIPDLASCQSKKPLPFIMKHHDRVSIKPIICLA